MFHGIVISKRNIRIIAIALECQIDARINIFFLLPSVQLVDEFFALIFRFAVASLLHKNLGRNVNTVFFFVVVFLNIWTIYIYFIVNGVTGANRMTE